MVKGLDKFKEHFRGFEDCYTIIGGTACDRWISEEGFTPRATNDIDIIIVLEAYNEEFNKKLWEFIAAAGYSSMQKEPEEQKFYRFKNPAIGEYPFQLELFCRDPKIIQIPDGSNITMIDLNEDFSHLSVMVMNDEYYQFTLEHSDLFAGIHIAKTEALICLKALAHLNCVKNEKEGKKVDSDDLKKHKYDVFRLAAILPGDETIELPAQISDDLKKFIELMQEEKPSLKPIYKAMRLKTSISLEQAIEQLENTFVLHD